MKYSCHNRFCKFYSLETHLWFATAHTHAATTALRMFASMCNMHDISWLSIIPQRTIWAMSIEQWRVKRL